jgi:hypothetical protein
VDKKKPTIGGNNGLSGWRLDMSLGGQVEAERMGVAPNVKHFVIEMDKGFHGLSRVEVTVWCFAPFRYPLYAFVFFCANSM